MWISKGEVILNTICNDNNNNKKDSALINTHEQHKIVDNECKYACLNRNEISTIAKVLNVSENEISDIQILKKGMTNRSFSFICKSEKYIIRIPGEGTN